MKPDPSACGSLKDIAYGTCLMDLRTILIIVGSVGGFLILTITVCCCYCCYKCKRNDNNEWQQKWESLRLSRLAANEDRKRERQLKMDEMRRKYGLAPSSNQYQKFS
ncbi:pituitary tumor-transforming gene 1 protein-interacting protein-like protein [Leptotrombidium deliense]|uniref:Pituitary tumor-transforming gene 1 protein-interacting protein-like protein n=1 Tax=Leptotrombidium deliense TaxID=299467 RepID=A0A443SWW2_9ACAR|nr:pituitary tumor-transforming gene 1 protein-interacting protein-like protein [Leptotrombidium deliense]